MLMPIVWLVAIVGFVGIWIGFSRLRDPRVYAIGVARREQRNDATEVDLKKAKSSGIQLLVLGVMLVGLWVFVQFFMGV
jgi:hypothetical protein